MKNLKKYFEIFLEIFGPHQPFDRLSLEMIRVQFEDEKTNQEQELIAAIPEQYLYSRIHEIEDETWNYIVNIHPHTQENEVSTSI